MTLLLLLSALLFAVIGYVTAWFVIARLSDRTDVVDTAWGLGFVYIVWLAYAISQEHGGLKLLAAIFVTIWGLRLTAHITTRNVKRSEDYRYVSYREKWKGNYWPTAYGRIFLVQGLLLWAISLSCVAIMVAEVPAWGWLAAIGFIVWGLGIIYETVGDWQLRRFGKTKKPGEIMTTGLWRYSRHPNYFGEIVTWCGAAIVAISYQQYWGIIGAFVISILIIKISGIPPLEKHHAGNKAFQRYAKKTSVLIPLPPKA